MDHRKRALILDGANDLYSLIQTLLDLSDDDPRAAELATATERYLDEIIALAEPAPRLLERVG